ncbi:hypothetical protein HPP92_021544 [Vanilla planifolia]|uniref:DOG1 domain-containing protein n=1 Tax=Vanilla planifolia TaxID=51239 RepID=A0A835Q5U1_VANPL|nr:hypothetical protein HPP92_021544 [Vanilla planifolia]
MEVDDKPSAFEGIHREDDEEAACGCAFTECLSRFLHVCCKRQSDASPKDKEHHPMTSAHRNFAARLERQLLARHTLDSLVEAYLARLRAHYLSPSAALLIPSWSPPPLAAAFSFYLSDFLRPSAILLSLAPRLLLPPHRLRALSSVARRLLAHEAALDQEMAEYQSTVILSLQRRRCRTAASAAQSIAAYMDKMASVVARAQRLRWRAIEAVDAELERDQAAHFFVGFAGLHEMIQRSGAKWAERVGPISLPVRVLADGAP